MFAHLRRAGWRVPFRRRRYRNGDSAAFPQRSAVRTSAHYPASRIRFVEVPAGEAGWHNPPGRVLAVWLDGVAEFETSDGEVRRVAAGGFVLVEDTHGKGHVCRHPVEGQHVILISLPDGLDPPSHAP